MLPLINKVVLITGSARRVGAASARVLHAAGASIVLHYRNAEADAGRLAEELNRSRPASTVLAAADLLDVAALPRLVHAAVSAFGRLDAVVNNASSFFSTPVGSITLAQWDDLIGTNLRAPLFLIQAAAPYLKKSRGSVVNITDIHADRPLKHHPIYSVAKAGLAGLTRSLAIDLAPEVRVNGVAPGPVLWPEKESVFDDAERRRVLGQTLMGHVGAPEDVARAVRFLIADAPYVTGQIIAVDGGRSIVL